MSSFGRFSLTGRLISEAQTRLFNFNEDNGGNNQNFFGTQVISNLEIQPFSYEESDGTPVSILTGFNLDAVIMTVTQTKNIITTPIQGRNGTVKEYISDGDYAIDIEGVIATRDNTYPESEVKALSRILKAPVPIKITSKFFTYFGISDVVVTNYEIPQQRGFENIQPFTFTCISDTPLELQEGEI